MVTDIFLCAGIYNPTYTLMCRSEYIETHPDPKLHNGFVKMTAFNARLLGQGVLNLSSWDIMTFQIALEKEYKNQTYLLDIRVSAVT